MSGELITRLSNEINACSKSNGLRQQIPVEFPMYKFYIQGDKVQKRPMQDMLLDVNQGHTSASRTDKERYEIIKRRSTILEKVVF